MATAARDAGVSRAAVPRIHGSWREEPDLPSSILLLPRHRRDRSSRWPGAIVRGCKAGSGRFAVHPQNRSPHRPGTMIPECGAQSGSFAVPIRQIVVLTGPCAMTVGTQFSLTTYTRAHGKPTLPPPGDCIRNVATGAPALSCARKYTPDPECAVVVNGAPGVNTRSG